jgi:hypothetical protein
MGTTTQINKTRMLQMHCSKEDDHDRLKWDYDGDDDDEADGEAWLSTSADDGNLPEVILACLEQ